MANQELFVLLLNAVVTGFAYFYIYPKFCGSDGNKIAIYDLFVGSVPLLSKGIIFWGGGVAFDLFFHHTLVLVSDWTLVYLGHIHRF